MVFISLSDFVVLHDSSHCTANLVQKHKSTLIVGNTYIMQNFKVAKNDFSFKKTAHKFN